MPKRPLEPPVANLAPTDGVLRGEVARIVLKIDAEKEAERARRAWASKLARAKWMTESGYHFLLRGGPPQ